jgi:hypothetical protein
MGWSLVQRSTTECGVSISVIVKRRKMTRTRPPKGCRATERKKERKKEKKTAWDPNRLFVKTSVDFLQDIESNRGEHSLVEVYASNNIYRRSPPPHGATALVVQGLLIIETSRSHSDTPQSVGLLWTRDQLVTETFTWQHTTPTRDRHPRHQRDSIPQSQ